MTRRQLASAVIGALTVGALLAGCSSTAGSRPGPGPAAATAGSRSLGAPFTAAHQAALVKQLPHRSIAPATATRLAAGLVPPTNRWFSGLVFGAAPQQVFPVPLAFRLTRSGFQAAIPAATASANTIASGIPAPLVVDLHATSAVVSAYDEVSVTLSYRSGGHALGRLTLAEGSPLLSYRADRAQTVALGAPTATAGGARTVRIGDQSWAVVTRGAVSGGSVSLHAGDSLQLVALPKGLAAADLARVVSAAASPLTGVATSYAATGSGQRTTLRYRTASGRPTLVVPLPHQGRAASSGCTSATFSTAYGRLPLCISGGLRFTTPTIAPTSALDLRSVSSAQRAELRQQLTEDVAARTPVFAADTYFGGKTLYRSAMLLQLAHQLGDTAAQKTLVARLTAQLDTWTQPGGCTKRGQQCFVYDPRLKTVVGLANSFGSEQDNDHHFHYGYFLYAAGVVAQYDRGAAARWAPVMDLLAADLASRSGGAFPVTRLYDPYFSHSWASGFSPFADGNNQESSSEAVNAWTGLSLWADASGNRALGQEAAWLLSGETASALAYWLNPNLSDPAFAAYTHPMVSLNWGDKRDFATWFSAAPSSVVAIQLIPMSPVSSYLRSPAAGGSTQIRRVLAAGAAKGYDVSLGDYLLMYRSLLGGAEARAALQTARAFPASAIDNGDSRTYLLAYIMSHEGQ